MVLSLFVFFFFMQKTAYDMRISYWSSDLCSSELGSSVLSGRSAGSGRAALRTPPSITKWATWIPLGASSRAALWARPRRPNLPIAKLEELAKPLTLAVAPVRRIAPLPRGSNRLAACWTTRNARNNSVEGTSVEVSVDRGGRSVITTKKHKQQRDT